MAVFRVPKNKDFTVMANHHLRNKNISLKAKGLQSLMLSLPEDWDYTLKGLSGICLDGVDSIRGAVKELERQGYIERRQLRGEDGRLSQTEYTIREIPLSGNPITGSPSTEEPTAEKPVTEKTTQLNTYESNTKELNTHGDNIHPINQKKGMLSDQIDEIDRRDAYKELIKENIDYDTLLFDHPYDKAEIDEFIEIMLDTVCSRGGYVTIGGSQIPLEVVKSRLLKLNMMHIEYVMDCLHENPTKVRNIKKYVLAALYNAPATIDNYYTTLVAHDRYNPPE